MYLSRPLKTPDFEVNIELNINQDLFPKQDATYMRESGLAIWYFHGEPKIPDALGSLYGMKSSYNGLGIFIGIKDGSYHIFAKANQGVQRVKIEDIRT